MRLTLYEWCCSGGLTDGDPSIAVEGRLMLEALAADAALAPKADVTVLATASCQLDLPPSARRIDLPPGADRAALAEASREADWTIVVAPESDGILLDRVRVVRGAGGRLLGPDDRVARVAADKQAAIERLAAAGIPVPAGRSLAGGEPLPGGFRLPAVRKARGGCGCEGLTLLHSRAAAPAASPTRIESLAAGTPVGVAVLGGPAGPLPLPPMRQAFTGGDLPRYLGGERFDAPAAAARATGLARRAAAAIGGHVGWLGVDMIIGDRPDGRADRVLEINPRVTTSIIGYRRLFASSLVAAMIEAAAGRSPRLVAAGGSPTGRFRLPLPCPAS